MRLIDADAFEHRFEDIYCKGCENYKGVRCRACEARDVADLVDSQPTVESKYRWHDLRRNPEDLPEDETLCIVLVYFGIWTEYGIARWSEIGFCDCFSESGGFVGEANARHEGISVIAWRRIEQFRG